MLEEDPVGVEEVDVLLRATPLLHRTHFAFLNGVEVRGGREGREGRRNGDQKGGEEKKHQNHVISLYLKHTYSHSDGGPRACPRSFPWRCCHGCRGLGTRPPHCAQRVV